MPGASPEPTQSRALRYIHAWGRGVVWFRLIGCCLFVPIMLFGAVAFPESRLVSIPAVPLLAYLAWRDVRTLRSITLVEKPLPPNTSLERTRGE